jgi:outer membrane protein with beta-barrel domain
VFPQDWHFYQFSQVSAELRMNGESQMLPMKRDIKRAAWTITWTVIWVLPLQAQNYESQGFSRLNSNAAFAVSAPLNPTARFATVAWGLTYGVGYNFSKHHSVLGEVMWNRLTATSEALAPIREALQNNDINGHGNLVAVTANYRLQFEGKTLGTYLITGGGLYYRDSTLSQHVVVGDSVSCTPAWLWWGFTCESGNVVSHQTLASSNSTAPGGNVGIGFTVKLPDSHYKFYVETRYHYATNKGVATHVIPVGVGVRF